MVVSLAGAAFSAEGISAGEVSVSDTIGYVSCADAELLALRTVQIRIGRDDCPWTDETEIAETVELYDFDGRVNGYLFRLKTGEKASGYVQVDVYAEAPQVVAFGYDCEAALDSMLKMQDKPAAASEDKIIYVGVYDYLQNTAEKSAEPLYRDVATGKTVSASAAELKASYRAMRAEQKDEAAKAALITLKANASLYGSTASVLSPAQIVYEDVYVPNLWNGWAPTSGHDFVALFGWEGVCAQTAAFNMLKYWYKARGISNLYLNGSYIDTFRALVFCMDYDFTEEKTPTYKTYTGTRDYLKTYNLRTEAGSDYRNKMPPLNAGFDWVWIKQQIKNGNALFIGTKGYYSLENDCDFGDNHAVLGVGYQDCNDGNWIRVADGYDESLSHFLLYTWDYEIEIWYLRW